MMQFILANYIFSNFHYYPFWQGRKVTIPHHWDWAPAHGFEDQLRIQQRRNAPNYNMLFLLLSRLCHIQQPYDLF